METIDQQPAAVPQAIKVLEARVDMLRSNLKEARAATDSLRGELAASQSQAAKFELAKSKSRYLQQKYSEVAEQNSMLEEELARLRSQLTRPARKPVEDRGPSAGPTEQTGTSLINDNAAFLDDSVAEAPAPSQKRQKDVADLEEQLARAHEQLRALSRLQVQQEIQMEASHDKRDLVLPAAAYPKPQADSAATCPCQACMDLQRALEAEQVAHQQLEVRAAQLEQDIALLRTQATQAEFQHAGQQDLFKKRLQQLDNLDSKKSNEIMELQFQLAAALQQVQVTQQLLDDTEKAHARAITLQDQLEEMHALLGQQRRLHDEAQQADQAALARQAKQIQSLNAAVLELQERCAAAEDERNCLSEQVAILRPASVANAALHTELQSALEQANRLREEAALGAELADANKQMRAELAHVQGQINQLEDALCVAQEHASRTGAEAALEAECQELTEAAARAERLLEQAGQARIQVEERCLVLSKEIAQQEEVLLRRAAGEQQQLEAELARITCEHRNVLQQADNAIAVLKGNLATMTYKYEAASREVVDVKQRAFALLEEQEGKMRLAKGQARLSLLNSEHSQVAAAPEPDPPTASPETDGWEVDLGEVGMMDEFSPAEMQQIYGPPRQVANLSSFLPRFPSFARTQ
ncbi:hypothetical protein WJX72_002912 [[Myrmecia] bisecta]|uniref:Uncharacterized protein n=1 Tax=[Myrmecia] bisecta TaxID=41462 RepID=A0AAW1QQQ1_9CHLO